MGRYRDNTDEAAQAADYHWSEFGDGPEYVPDEEVLIIEIFGGNGCRYCAKAILLCQEKSIEYRYYNVDESSERFDQLVGRIGSWKTVPQIFVGAKHVGGFDALKKELG
jgi:glutaredoxin